jgi:hypothetical protein
MLDTHTSIRWVIQERIFGEETAELVKHIANYSLRGNDRPTANEPMADIYRGSIEFIEMFGSPWLTLDNYRCSKYYAWVPNLLNVHCMWMPWWKLASSMELIEREFPGQGVFIRPDVGRKLFTGTTLSYRWWQKELEIIRELPGNTITDDAIVLIAAKRTDLRTEYRLVMHQTKILGHSVYAGEAEPSDWERIEQLVNRNSYFPDLLYTLDVAFTTTDIYVLELNSFVSSGLYEMNFQQLVPQVEATLLAQRNACLGK